MQARLDAGEVPAEKVADQVADIEFMKEHWTPVGSMLTTVVFQCDQYDWTNKLCMAHNSRPPVCRGYPGFGREITADQLWHFPRCEFWADVSSDERPPGWQPVLMTTKPKP